MDAISSPADLQAWLRSRRSMRRFADRPVLPDLLRRVLETATWAPNAHNRQPWRFVHLASPESRARLSAAMADDFRQALEGEGRNEEEVQAQLARSAARIAEAPEAVLLCLDTTVLDRYEDESRSRGEYLMGVQSVALASGQLLLAAHADGLGGVWICAPLFVPGEVSQALDLPAEWEAQGLLLLGYPGKQPPQRPRKDLGDVLVER